MNNETNDHLPETIPSQNIYAVFDDLFFRPNDENDTDTNDKDNPSQIH